MPKWLVVQLLLKLQFESFEFI